MTISSKMPYAGLRFGPIARGALSSITIRVTSLALGFIQAILTARLLGPEGYGIIAVAMSVQGIAAALTTLGLSALAVREVARLVAASQWSLLRGLLRFSTSTVLIVSTSTALGIAAISLWTPLFGEPYWEAVALAAAVVPPFAMLSVFRSQSQGFGRIVAAQAAGELLRPGIIVATFAVLLATGTATSPFGYIGVAIMAATISAIAAMFVLWRIASARVPPRPPEATPRAWGAAAAPFLGITLLTVIGSEANTLMLGFLAGPEEAGLFQPIARITPIMIIAIEAISIPLAPRLAALWQDGNRDAINHLFRRATAVGTIGTATIIVALLILAPAILQFFGRAFLVNLHLLWWIALAQIFNAAFGAAGLLLAMAGAMQLRLAVQAATLLVQMGAGLLLIGPYGAAGATAALIASILTWSFGNWLVARTALGIETSLLALWPRGKR